jgi:DNA-binding NtrC family response regulator
MNESVRVCCITGDLEFFELIAHALGPEYELRVTDKFSPAAIRGQQDGWDVVLLDMRKPDPEANGGRIQLMEEIRQLDSAPPIVALVDEDDRSWTCRVFEKGAYDTVACPPNIAEFRFALRRAHRFHQVEKELHSLQSETLSGGCSPEFVVVTESMRRVLAFTRKVAPCDVSVLITGETGTGKELLAREIHRLSSRAGGPFIAFSCANLPETLIEDELFGHEKGAYTGAAGSRCGRIELADQGTLFLDEIGEFAVGLQAKLLRVLQQRTFERLGSNTPVHVNFRLVCATHRNLQDMVEHGQFREDLYYRLNVVQVQLPPLRERRDGLGVLSQHFLQRFAKQFGKGVRRISPSCLRAMEEYGWPGNIRELENVIQRAVVLAEGATIEVWHLPKTVRHGFEQAAEIRSYEDEVREFKRRLIQRTLQECGGNKAESAKALGIARAYLHRLINQLQIGGPESSPSADFFDDEPIPEQVM